MHLHDDVKLPHESNFIENVCRDLSNRNLVVPTIILTVLDAKLDTTEENKPIDYISIL